MIRSADNFKNAIIFCNRKREVALLHKSLLRHKFNAVALHGDLDQSARTAALDAFRSGEAKILVASDVAARGLDIPAVSHIFNFDVPHHPDDYVHRIGRTGRAGLSGTAITLVAPADIKSVAAIERLTGQPIPSMGAPAPAAGQESRPPQAERSQGERSHGERHRGERSSGGRSHGRPPRQDSHQERQPERQPERQAERQPERQPQQRPPHAAQPRPANTNSRPGPPNRSPSPISRANSDGSHLPAFLLRPVTLKA